MTKRPCTCTGTAPGYPQHEGFCGQPEVELTEDEEYMEALVVSMPPAEDEVRYLDEQPSIFHEILAEDAWKREGNRFQRKAATNARRERRW